MKKWILFLLFPLSVQASDLWMKVGEVRSLPAPTGKAVRIGSRGIIRVIDGEISVRVVALKPGVTPLVITLFMSAAALSATSLLRYANTCALSRA